MKSKLLTVFLLTIVLAAYAEEPWRFITIADWHSAEKYTQSAKNPSWFADAVDADIANVKMLKAKFGGDLIMLPGDSQSGHWDGKKFIQKFKPGLSPSESILQAGKLCYSGMVSSFKKGGYSRLLMAVGDHEMGDNPWPPGSAKSKCQAQFRQAFANVFNVNPDGGRFMYQKPIGTAASRPLGTKYETTSYAYRYKNALFVTVDVFHQESPNKKIGSQGSVTGVVTNKHLAWFDQVLAEARKDSSIKHIFVQAHLPVLHPVRKVNSSGMLMDGEMDCAFWKTMRKYNVDIYFAGEVHSNTVTKDPLSDLVQVVSRGNFFNNFLTVDLTDNKIDVKCYNQLGAKPSDGKYEVSGRLVIDKSTAKKTFQDEGDLAFLDRNARLFYFDFEKDFALKDRQVLGLKGKNTPIKQETWIRKTPCKRSFPNRGEFGRNYDAQYCQVKLVDGPRGKAGEFTPKSRMAIWGMGPHHGGHMVSYALWVKTTSKDHMVLINSGSIWQKNLANFMNLNLDNGQPELMISLKQRLLVKEKKLNDGTWHHIAVSMPRDDCKLSEVAFYIDGKAVGSKVVGKDQKLNFNQAVRLSFGGIGHSAATFSKLPTKPFVGAMDEISIWCRALSASEVAALAK